MALAVSGTLVANTVTSVQVDHGLSGLEIVNRSGTAEIWVTFDGTTPAVGTGYCVAGAIYVWKHAKQYGGTVTVKLFSTGTPSFAVHGS